ncbi:hypothetical protein A1F94_013211 [Pyrenophora tritici-repentis]|nr:hypothetical protein A1F94_013211 [Pyrenophora tritici-repentis]KAI1684527.1 hypothetical protein KJE20_04811 [Pyrenophora tritici-repentis]
MPSILVKRKPEAAEEADTPFKRAQRTRKPTLKAPLGDELLESTPDPPTEPPTQVIEPPTRAIEPPLRALAEAKSKVHISFDGWTTKGGKRGFFSVVAHYANSKGAIVDLPIALPQLVGAYTSEAIADAITKILQSFSINRSKLGYFVLDNAYNNDTAVNKLAAMYYFSASDRRLRCACYILNLVG